MKKILSTLAASLVAVTSVFASAPAFAVSRTAGQVNQDAGGSDLLGATFDQAGTALESEWDATAVDGSTMYVAGMDWETDEIIVSKFVSGVLDSSFGGDGVANFELFDEYNGGFDSVSDIEIAPNGDLVILGAAWTCAEFSNCVDAIIALRINSSGTTTGVTWGNALGSTMTNAELPLFAEIVDLGQDLNYDWADSWGAGLEVMNLEGDYFWALGGSTETDYDEVGWVLILNNSGQIDTTVGNADFADGFHVFDSSYSADGIQDTECFSWSVMNDIEWNASADRLFIIGQCDGDPIIEALHPYDNFSANLDFANAGGEPVAWVSTYSPNADFWELELRGDDLIVGGNNWKTVSRATSCSTRPREFRGDRWVKEPRPSTSTRRSTKTQMLTGPALTTWMSTLTAPYTSPAQSAWTGLTVTRTRGCFAGTTTTPSTPPGTAAPTAASSFTADVEKKASSHWSSTTTSGTGLDKQMTR